MKRKKLQTVFARPIGARLRFLRKSLNLKQKQFCVFLGVNQSQMSKIERGVQDVPASKLMEVADRFGLSTDWFFDDDCIT